MDVLSRFRSCDGEAKRVDCLSELTGSFHFACFSISLFFFFFFFCYSSVHSHISTESDGVQAWVVYVAKRSVILKFPSCFFIGFAETVLSYDWLCACFILKYVFKLVSEYLC